MTDTKVVPTEPNVPATDLATLTVEIKFYLHQSAQSIIEVGKRLIKAKEMVPHGEWANWLENNFRLKKTLAHNFMQVAKRFGDSSNNQNFRLNGNLNQTQLIAMLALPEGEEEKFIAEKAAEGTPVEDMTVRKLNEEIRHWKQKAEDTEKILAKTTADLNLEKEKVEIRDAQLDNSFEDFMKIQKEVKAAKEKIEELKDARDDLQEDVKLKNYKIEELERTCEDLRIDLEIGTVKEVPPSDYEDLKREIKELRERPVEVAVETPADYESTKAELAELKDRESSFKQTYVALRKLDTLISALSAVLNESFLQDAVNYWATENPAPLNLLSAQLHCFCDEFQKYVAVAQGEKSREEMIEEIKSLSAERGDSTVKDFVQAAGLNTVNELNDTQLGKLLKQLQSR